MPVSIQTLRERLEDFLYELGSLRYRFGAGLSAELPLGRLYASYPEFARAESFIEVREAAERAREEEGERARLGLLLEFLAGHVEDGLAAEPAEAVAALEAKGEVRVGNEQVPFRDGMARLTREAQWDKRDALERALGDFLWERQDAYARWREAAAKVSAELGYRSYLAMREAVTGDSLAELSSQCEVVLRETEDAYRDVLAYALKRVDPQLKPGAARRHDALRAARAPWLDQHYRKEDLLPGTMRWLSEMGFDPYARGRIQLDAEDRPGKSARAFVADLRVPDDVRLVVRPGGGLDDAFALFQQYGHALRLAHAAKTAPVEDRRLGDPSVAEGFASAFDHVLLDPHWHRRYLRLPAAAAEDGARMSAFARLLGLRRSCAKLPYELALYERGPLRPLAESYEDRQEAALLVGVHPGFYLWDVEPQLYVTRRLKAWSLEARLTRTMMERFDQDYWRNPATGRWLEDLFSPGQPERVDAFAKRVLGGPLSLQETGKRLIAALNR